jgi:hypothetical protein
MKFSVDGKKYDIELDSLSLDEGEILEDYAKCDDLRAFVTALQRTRVRAIRALVLIAKRRAGETVEWADLGSLDLMDLAASIITENGIDVSEALDGQSPADVTALNTFLEQKRTVKNRADRRANPK